MMIKTDTVHALTSLPATDLNFTSCLQRATQNQIRLALETMRNREGKDKGRIKACEMELRRREKAAVWQRPCDCTEIIRVIGEADETGRIVRMLLPMQDNDAGMFGNELSRCVTTKLSEYAMSRYSLYAPDHAFFRVYPPVPVGVDKWVMLECFVRPIVEDMGFNVPDELVTLVKHWVIYRALMVDSENNATVTEVAMNHFKVHQELFKGLMALRARETADDSVRAVQKRPSE